MGRCSEAKFCNFEALPVDVFSPDESINTCKRNRKKWVIQIQRTLDEELEEDIDIPVSIFNVPKILLANNPDSYIPQQVALGPYHYSRPELYEMERYKISAAKRTQKNFQNIKFHHLVNQFKELEPKIRACYHKYLDFSDETLAWMMAIDASFLLEFLQIYTISNGKALTRVSSRMSHLVDVLGRKSAHNAILRDLIMLENQIPLFALSKILEFQFATLDLVDEMLFSMFVGLCRELSPFKKVEQFPNIKIEEISHLLHFLYHVIVPKPEEQDSEITEVEEQGEVIETKESSPTKLKCGEEMISKLTQGIKRVFCSKHVKSFLKIPWLFISSLPGLRALRLPVEYIFFSEEKEKRENEILCPDNNISKPPLIEEIAIPSVSELVDAGVQFLPTNGTILTINFDLSNAKFYLPTVSLDVNTEAVMRNLVAYEACNASGPLVFTRYTELMNGIIDTEEDVRLLREKGVILNRLKTDEEVANLWNGMSKSLRLTKVPFLDKVIEDVNKYYHGRWKIKLGKFMKIYVFGSWRFLTLLAAVLLLFLMSLQTFCTMFGCFRFFHGRRI